jgi:hypothetical protein
MRRKRDSNYLLIIVGDAERMLSFNSRWRGKEEAEEGRREEKSINSLPFPCGAFFSHYWISRKEETFDFFDDVREDSRLARVRG